VGFAEQRCHLPGAARGGGGTRWRERAAAASGAAGQAHNAAFGQAETG